MSAPASTPIGRKIAQVQQKVRRHGTLAKADESEHPGAAQPKPGGNSPTCNRVFLMSETTSKAWRLLSAQKIDETHAMLEQRRKQAHLEEELTDAVAYSPKAATGNLAKFARRPR